MHCSVIEHGMTSLSFQTAVQKNEAKLFHINVLTILQHSHIQSDVIAALFSDNAWLSQSEVLDTMF